MSKVLKTSSLGGSTPCSASPTESKKHEKTVPNYLRASRGSCHDLCKYGQKNPSEEEPSFLGVRRKKLPAHLNNLTLHRSAILDRSKDVRDRGLSLAKSSLCLYEVERVAPRRILANQKGVASNEHMGPRTAKPAEHKILNFGGIKKQPIVSQKVSTNLKYSNGAPKFDKKDIMPVKGPIFSATSKFPEKTLLEKSRTLDKVSTASRSLQKRPSSAPTNLYMIKQVHVPSQASDQHLFSKDKSTPKGKVTSPAASITRVSAKPGQSPTRLSKSIINGKEGLVTSISSFSAEAKLTASAGVQYDDVRVASYYVDSTHTKLHLDATEGVDDSRLAPEETIKSTLEDDVLGSTENSEVPVGEVLLGSAPALELQQSLDSQGCSTMLGDSDLEHKLAEQNVIHDRASKDNDSQTDDAALCRVSEHLIAVENAGVYDPVLTKGISKIEDDQVKVNATVQSIISDGKKEVGVQEDFERFSKLLAPDEKHAGEPESFLDLAFENAAEFDKADEASDGKMNNCTTHCQSISETSDGELLEEPKSEPVEPSDSAIDELARASNKNTSEQDGLKLTMVIPQSPEELSDDEFYNEYDYDLSESDESSTEDEEATINRNGDESSAGDHRPRRITEHETGDASITPYKLKFKRGKIVELPPDSGGPRRLKFRRKAANELSNRESKSTRRVYKKDVTNSTVPTNPDEESPGVKLRHQDTQEKKDAQGLFNNVIEETASKLVESRKSKVKALVGAFETVISLQDGKPTSSTPHASNTQDLIHDDEGKAPEEAE